MKIVATGESFLDEVQSSITTFLPGAQSGNIIRINFYQSGEDFIILTFFIYILTQTEKQEML